jgi:Spy/CpxP family protein refolding chaperone
MKLLKEPTMNRTRIAGLAAVVTLLLLPCHAGAQEPGKGDEMVRRRPERLERYRKMRLIETLKLNEEDAVRFFSKQSAHEDAQRDLFKGRNHALDELDKILHGTGSDKEMPKLSDEIQTIDEKIFSERQRYQNEVQKSLTPEQFAKFLLFERDFNRQVRDALEEMRGERGRKYKP